MPSLEFQLIVRVPNPDNTPFAALVAKCDEEQIHFVHYLRKEDCEKATVVAPRNQWIGDLENQLRIYLEDPKSACFDDMLPRLRRASVLPINIQDRNCRRKMQDIICGIPCGRVLAYSDIAPEIVTSNQNVGRACGNNLVGIVIPCYRVVDKRNGVFYLGKYSRGNPYVDEVTGLKIKRWLLEHEGCKVSPPDKSPNESDLSKWEVHCKSS